jgi:DNA-directed RNA polymerase specialized sigma24 family protein
MANFFDLDVSFDGDEPDLSAISAEQLEKAVAELPEALESVARALLIEKRTMSDVSQHLGIRQGELVTRLHRAMLAISMSIMGGGRPH